MDIKPKAEWWPMITAVVINLVSLGVVYGKMDQRIVTLELLRVEARNEVQSQLAVIDAKVTRLLERTSK